MEFYVKTFEESLEWSKKNRLHAIATFNIPNAYSGKCVYANLLSKIESKHWESAEFKAHPDTKDFSIAVGFGNEYDESGHRINKGYVLICDGPRACGVEHHDQRMRMSQAFRELIAKTLEDTHSPEKKDWLNKLLENYKEYGCDESSYTYFNEAQYDDGTTRDVSKEKQAAGEILLNDVFGKSFEEFFRGTFEGPKKEEPEPEKVSSIDDLISRATAISEQSKGLADDLSKFKDGFEKD